MEIELPATTADPPKLLVIDDDPLIRQCMALALPAPDYIVITAATAEAGMEQFRTEQPDAVLLDNQLPDQSGLSVLQELRDLDRRIPVILMTGFGSAETAISSISGGAFEYITKPFEPDAILPIIDSALETSRMARRPALLPTDQTPQGHTPADAIVGSCPEMVEVFRAIGRVAARDVAVLILGETGTGKEVVARSIYQHSRRKDQLFHAINCAAIPEALLESELFGHEKGAFTGADQRRVGKFEICRGGTLFLDEIGDMSPVMQTKLLRVLQEKEFERLGSNQTLKTDVRIIAATNRDLESAIEDKSFRSDLFYRLNEYTIRLPPLRDRAGDIARMVNYFFTQYSELLGKEFTSVSPEVIRAFSSYRWPGNVRELQGVVKQSLLNASGPVITPSCLPRTLHQPKTVPNETPTSWEETFRDHVRATIGQGTHDLMRTIHDSVDRVVLDETLRAVGGNLSEASIRLGISRPTLRTRLKHLAVKTDS